MVSQKRVVGRGSTDEKEPVRPVEKWPEDQENLDHGQALLCTRKKPSLFGKGKTGCLLGGKARDITMGRDRAKKTRGAVLEGDQKCRSNETCNRGAVGTWGRDKMVRRGWVKK